MSLVETCYSEGQRERKKGKFISSVLQFEDCIAAKGLCPEDDIEYSKILSGYAATLAAGNQKELAFLQYFTAAEFNENALQSENFESLFMALMRDSWACKLIGKQRMDKVIFCEICEDSFDYFLEAPTSGHTVCNSCLTLFDVCPTCHISFYNGNIQQRAHDTTHISSNYLTPNDNRDIFEHAMQIYNLNSTQEAVKYAINYVHTRTVGYKLLVLLSEMLYTLRDYESSQFYANKAIELRRDTGKYSHAYYRRGLASFKLNDYKDALISIYKAMCLCSPLLVSNYNEIKETICSSLLGLARSSSLLPPCKRAKYLCDDLQRELRCWANLPVHTSNFNHLVNHYNWAERSNPLQRNIVYV